MKSRICNKTLCLIAALLVLVASGCWLAQLAWAEDGANLVADSGAALRSASGESVLLENSWRYENGRPIEGLVYSEGEEGETALSAQSELSAQAAAKEHFGIDVSEHQGSIDWSKVAESVEYAIIRCGYGDDIASQDDKYWKANVSGCRAAGIPMGVYLYSYATDASMARSEALHVVRCMKEAGLSASSLSLPIYLDMEDASTVGSDFVAIFDMFKSTLAANGYADVGIYANCNWWRNYLGGIQLEASKRWVAHWGVDDPFDGYSDLEPKGYGVWQYGIAAVAGISGAVDGNYKKDPVPAPGERDMYRMYNPNSGEHFYTASVDERDFLIGEGWKYEGIGWHAPVSSSTPVFRLYNAYGGEHHYTTSAEEKASLVNVGWTDEGIGWYSDDAESVPLYREYNPNAFANNHNYTTSADEHKNLLSLGWRDEGYAWYGV